MVSKIEGADPPALASAISKLAAATSAPATTTAAVSTAAATATAATAAAAAAPESAASVEGRIKWLLASNPVVLFMKGSADTPRCGFSGRVVAALQAVKVCWGLERGVGGWGQRACCCEWFCT